MPWQNRIARASCAILVCLGLMAGLYFQRISIEAAEKTLSLALISSAWKTSELVFEGQRLAHAMHGYSASETGLDNLQTRFDVFWSRVAVIGNVNMDGRPRLSQSVRDLAAFLEKADMVIFSDLMPPRNLIEDLQQDLEELIVETRVTWINENNASAFEALSPASVEIARLRSRWEIATASLVLVVLVYLLVELLFASKAHRREVELTQSAQAASEMKSTFIANVSHEIRTPLNGVLGMARSLSDTKLDEDQKACVAVIEEAGELLLSTINDVLDYSKIEAGELAISTSNFDPVSLAGNVKALYDPIAKEKGLSLDVVVPQDQVLPFVHGDARRLRQVLQNLVANAIKFTASGRVEIEVSYQAEETKERPFGLYLTVRDTGIGISGLATQKIFEPFGQADDSTSRSYGGTGLGLTISRDYCRAMGGDLTVESTVGQGSTFTAFAPFCVAAGDAPAEKAVETDDMAGSADVSELRVIVVDDNRTNRLILRRFMSPLGISPVEFECGPDLLDHIKEHDADLILMDVQMPGMDGVETTLALKRLSRVVDCPLPQVVAVTANTLTHQVEEYLAAGMARVLSKPVSKAALIQVLTETASTGKPEPADRETAAA